MSLSARVTWRSFQAGALRMVFPGLASLPFGIGFGVVAAQKGLSAFETTLLGHLAAGSLLSDPGTARRFGLDFVAIAVFVMVATIMFRGRRDLAPWAVVTRTFGGFTPGLFAAVGAAALARWAGLA